MSLDSDSPGPKRQRQGPGARTTPFVQTMADVWHAGSDAVSKTKRAQETAHIFSAIETEIIPRLMLVSAPPDLPYQHTESKPLAVINAADRDRFLLALIGSNWSDADGVADRLLTRGIGIDTLFIDLFAWAARRLGEMWEDDEISFTEVTIGLCRLHEALHRNTDRSGHGPALRRGAPGIILGSVPGEQHIFGVVMAADFFRRSGWMVVCEPGSDAPSLLKLAADTHVDLIGLSAAHDGAREGLAGLIRSLKAASRNPAVKIMLGGRLFEAAPELINECGADAFAGDAQDAPDIARKLLAMA